MKKAIGLHNQYFFINITSFHVDTLYLVVNIYQIDQTLYTENLRSNIVHWKSQIKHCTLKIPDQTLYSKNLKWKISQ